MREAAANRRAYLSIDWGQASCSYFPSSWWHTPGDEEKAKEVCEGCPILSECQEYALSYEGSPSIWGKLTLKEREKKRGRRYQDLRSRAEKRGADPD